MTDDPPDPSDPPKGCPFHPACPKAREACRDERPNLFEDEVEDHGAACFREDQTHEYWDSEPLHEEEGEIPL